MTTDHRVGTTVGDYVIDGVLGRGGMGVVYRARHRLDDRVVALKLMLPELAANEDFRDRFIREAEFAPSLDHPNIVRVYETGEIAGELFIAMHLVQGCDLKTLIKREGPLAPRRALSILAQAASALDAAHEMVVVHRDVKPQNIMISPGEGPDPRDLVFLTDFGLIRPAASESTASRTGQIFGSIQYMAPEQIEGLPADGRADVYSLACVAYECFTGRIPFERPNEIGAIWAHIHEEPPRVSQVRPELPGGIDDVIRQGMAKHPDDRYLTCGELVTELEGGLKKQRRQLVPTPLRPLVTRISRPKTEREIWAPNFFPELSRVRKLTNRTNWPQTIGLTAILLLLAAAFVQFAHDGGITQAVANVASGVTDTVQEIIPGDAREDGADVAAGGSSGPEAGNDEVARAGGSKARLTGGTDGSTATSRTAAPRRMEVTERVGSAVGKGRTLARTKIAFMTYSRGSASSGSVGSQIFTMNADGTDLTQVSRFPPNDSVVPLDWSPDGTKLLFNHNPAGGWSIDGYNLYIMKADGSDVVRLTDSPTECTYTASWSPDGSRIAYDTTCDLDTEPGAIYLIDADGTNRVRFEANGHTDVSYPEWSPNGKSLVFSSTRGGQADLYVANVDGSGVRQLTNDPSIDFAPKWSSRGQIAWSKFVGSTEIFVMDDDGTNQKRLTFSDDRDQWPSWSPDGKHIAFSTRRHGHWRNYVMTADGRHQKDLSGANLGDRFPVWSPWL